MKKAWVQVLGAGEAFSEREGNTAFWFRSNDPSLPEFLVDCGYQVPERYWRALRRERIGKRSRSLQGVFFTHLHADHAFGIVPLLVRFWEESRRETLLIAGPRGVRSYVERLLDLGYPGLREKLSFPLVFHEWKSSETWSWSGLRVRCASTRHSVPNYCLRIEGEGFSFAVSGDGGLTVRVKELLAGVGVHFQECYTAEPRFPTHADLRTSLSMFQAIGNPRLLVFTHLQRSEEVRIRTLLKALRPRGLRVKIARSGQIFLLSDFKSI